MFWLPIKNRKNVESLLGTYRTVGLNHHVVQIPYDNFSVQPHFFISSRRQKLYVVAMTVRNQKEQKTV